MLKGLKKTVTVTLFERSTIHSAVSAKHRESKSFLEEVLATNLIMSLVARLKVFGISDHVFHDDKQSCNELSPGHGHYVFSYSW